jgi:uncharacterized membrane protein YdjX (TVP38/TMEM64 family)
VPSRVAPTGTIRPGGPPRVDRGRRRVDRGRRRRLLLAALVIAGLAVAALLAPVPSPTDVRSWANTAGAPGAALFVLGTALVTVAPVPRTVFTLAAGLLFGPVGGVTAALLATMISALLAFGLVRALGRNLVAPLLDGSTLRTIDGRLRRRGWLAVASLRLIPLVPFSVLNYCSALSSIRWQHYVVGTVGVVPGTVAMVLLGDALAGTTSPMLIAVAVLCAAAGVVGLLVDARMRLPAPGARSGGRAASRPPAVRGLRDRVL